MPKMRKNYLVHIITGLNTGGAETALYNILSAELAKQFNCYVISLMDKGTIGQKIKSLDVPVICLGMNNGLPSLKSIRKLRSVVREIQPDIIQGWMYHGNIIATFACKLAKGSPVLAWNVRHSLYDLNHEKFMTRQVVRLNRLFSSLPDALLYNSQLSQQQHEAFGFSSDNGQTIPNGINVHKFSFSEASRKKIRNEFNISDKVLVVGHVARYHPIKDHTLFLKAAVDIAKRNIDVDFLLCGRGVSMNNESIQSLIPLNLRSRFHLLEERSDVPQLLSAMDFFCLSSWSEAFPNVIGEAMATSLPCIATDVGDSKIIIGDTGVIVPARSEKELIDGIDKLLKLPKQERQALGKKARSRIEENFTLSAIVEKYTLLYKKLIAEKRVR